MKILTTEQVLQSLQREPKNNVQTLAEKKFNVILKDRLKNTATPSTGTLQATFIKPTPVLHPTSRGSSDQIYAADSIEDMINILDEYREKLADPRITMKQLDADIKEMTRGMENLAHLLESHPVDERLRNIFNQTMVTISLEISKFYRGDYISA
jgi:hypothetical protein